MTVGVCVQCGTEFKRKARGSKDAGLCCSRVCGWKYQHAQAAQRHAIIALERAVEHKAARTRTCPSCEVVFTGRRKTIYCSARCRQEHAVAQQLLKYRERSDAASKSRHCRECSGEFKKGYGKTGLRHFCSIECRRAFVDKRNSSVRNKRLASWSGKLHVRRAKRAGAPVESGVTRRAVFVRDGWTCQVCRRPVLREVQRRSGPRHELSPELDHIVPIAKGGGHTWNNVQCLCRRCNHVKGDRVESSLQTLSRVDAAASACEAA